MFYIHYPIDRIAHTMTFVIPVVEHWLEQEIAHYVHQAGSIQLMKEVIFDSMIYSTHFIYFLKYVCVHIHIYEIKM